MHSKKILQVMLILLGATLVIFGFQLIQENRLPESGFGPSSPLISFYHIVRIIQGLFIIVLGFTLDYFLKNSSKMLASVIAAIGVMEVLTGHFLGIKILIIFVTIYLFYSIKKLPNDSPKILLILTVVAGVIETLFAIYTTGILIAPFIILLTIYLVRNFLKITPPPVGVEASQPSQSNEKKEYTKIFLCISLIFSSLAILIIMLMAPASDLFDLFGRFGLVMTMLILCAGIGGLFVIYLYKTNRIINSRSYSLIFKFLFFEVCLIGLSGMVYYLLGVACLASFATDCASDAVYNFFPVINSVFPLLSIIYIFNTIKHKKQIFFSTLFIFLILISSIIYFLTTGIRSNIYLNSINPAEKYRFLWKDIYEENNPDRCQEFENKENIGRCLEDIGYKNKLLNNEYCANVAMNSSESGVRCYHIIGNCAAAAKLKKGGGNGCFKNFAEKTRDSQYCDIILNSSTGKDSIMLAAECYARLAEITNNVSYCSKVLDIINEKEALQAFSQVGICADMFLKESEDNIVVNTIGCGNLIDADGNQYKTVKIGNHCWMAENLRTRVTLSEYDRDCISFDNNQGSEDDCNIGYTLYTWAGAMNLDFSTEGTQGICPTGWHIPTDQDWHILESTLADDPNKNCDASRQLQFGCNGASQKLVLGGSSGFNSLFSGIRTLDTKGPNFIYSGRGEYAWYWTSTSNNLSEHNLAAWSYQISRGDIMRRDAQKSSSLSVRCIKDEI